MSSYFSLSEIDSQLERLKNGERPAFAGPEALSDMYAQRRRRQLRARREKLLRRAALWMPPPRPKCSGPTMCAMAMAQLCSYLSTVLLAGSAFVFLLWYFGILAYIIWLFKAIKAVIGCLVSSLSY